MPASPRERVAPIEREILDRIRQFSVGVLEKAITRLVIRLAPSLFDSPGACASTGA